MIGSAAPNFTLTRSNPGGGTVTLSSLLGEVVYINFFGATCPICISDAWISEQIYQQFLTNPSFNMLGIDVWNLPAAYVNTTFRANTGITYPLLVNGRSTGIAYNMETNPVPSPTDVEHRGHVIIDQQGIIRYYAIYDPLDTLQQREMICVLKSLLDMAPARPMNAAISVLEESSTLRLSWLPDTTCPLRYTIYKSVTGDWTDLEIIGATTEPVFLIETLPDSMATYHVTAEYAQP
ncbi:MAG: TlpA family protein disulfide reductase [bacterium]|nr:TlpA family protein disulfide reductase [bacterium]